MTEEKLILELSGYGWDATNVKIAIRANCQCEYCDKNMLENIHNYKLWQIDHIIPKCSGMDFCEEFDNKALSCTHCNKDFKAKWNPQQPNEVRQERSEYIKRIRAYIDEKRKLKSKQLVKINELFDSYFEENNIKK